MDSAVRIEPRFENPDSGSKLDDAVAAPQQAPVAQSVMSAGSSLNTWLYQNCYLVGGCILIVLVIIGLAFWFRKPAETIRPGPVVQHMPNNAQAAYAIHNGATPPANDAVPPTQPAPAQTPAQAPAQTPAQAPAPASPAPPAPIAPAPQLTQQALQDKLKAVAAARQQPDRQPIAEVSDGDLDSLMEDPGKTPETQDLAIMSHI